MKRPRTQNYKSTAHSSQLSNKNRNIQIKTPLSSEQQTKKKEKATIFGPDIVIYDDDTLEGGIPIWDLAAIKR